MSEHTRHIDHISLIGKYFDFEATPEEISYLEHWVKDSKENELLFKSYRKTLQLSHTKNLETQLNLNSEWEELSSKLSKNKTLEIKTESNSKKNRPLWFSIAAGLLIIISFSVAFYLFQDKTILKQTRSNTLALVLQDQSEIMLNRNSSIEYSNDYNLTERRVSLNGDAFFEVSPDKQKPFIVEAGDIEVKVLGTAFYIDSRNSSNNIEVFVKHGKVSVTEASGKSVILTAGEKAIYSKTSKTLNEAQNQNLNFDSWKTKSLVFEQTPLEEVIKTINKTYYTNLTIENDTIKSIPLTASYQNKSLNAVLKILSESLDIIYVEKGKKIVVEAKE